MIVVDQVHTYLNRILVKNITLYKFQKFTCSNCQTKVKFHRHKSKKSNNQQDNLKQLMIIQISKFWAWILLLISISASILLSSIVFVITKLEPIDEMESIKKDKIQLNCIDVMVFQIDENYLEGVSSSNLQILSQSHICVEVIKSKELEIRTSRITLESSSEELNRK